MLVCEQVCKSGHEGFLFRLGLLLLLLLLLLVVIRVVEVVLQEVSSEASKEAGKKRVDASEYKPHPFPAIVALLVGDPLGIVRDVVDGPAAQNHLAQHEQAKQQVGQPTEREAPTATAIEDDHHKPYDAQHKTQAEVHNTLRVVSICNRRNSKNHLEDHQTCVTTRLCRKLTHGSFGSSAELLAARWLVLCSSAKSPDAL